MERLKGNKMEIKENHPYLQYRWFGILKGEPTGMIGSMYIVSNRGLCVKYIRYFQKELL